MKPFYMILRESGTEQHIPRKAHEDEKEVKSEMERLARENPGVKFLLLEPSLVAYIEPIPAQPVKWSRFKPDIKQKKEDSKNANTIA